MYNTFLSFTYIYIILLNIKYCRNHVTFTLKCVLMLPLILIILCRLYIVRFLCTKHCSKIERMSMEKTLARISESICVINLSGRANLGTFPADRLDALANVFLHSACGTESSSASRRRVASVAANRST